MKNILYFAVAAALVFCGCKKEVKTATGSIYGVIADKATGEPVKSAGVELQPIGSKTVTGSEGQYEFANLAAGDYTLSVTKTGYADLLNYAIKVEAGKINKGDVQIEVLPPSLRVVDNNRQDIDLLDFGSAEDDITRGFNIFNDGVDPLEWEIITTSDWITELSKTSGTLQPGKTQGIIVTIDRDKLSGERTTTVHVTSDNGSKQIMVKAVGKTAAAVNTLDATNISKEMATLNGEIITVGIPRYTECGFVYDTLPTPTLTISTAKLTASITENTSYSADASGLTQGTTYYVRAYAINKVDTAYGAPKSFTTLSDYVVLASDGIAVQKTDISKRSYWETANSMCASSNIGGKNWRLPTTAELAVLYNNKTAIGNFSTDNYWSSVGSTSRNNTYNNRLEYYYDIFNFSSGRTGSTMIYYYNLNDGTKHDPYDPQWCVRCVRTLP
ncbi:hypothetical protein AGMMS4956_10810 [Bacteroidia bacterium]|nr:hypothetical protein AGMMS4956_10810 [Bacteroidia bacterium]